jgi:hypothetical protein
MNYEIEPTQQEALMARLNGEDTGLTPTGKASIITSYEPGFTTSGD